MLNDKMACDDKQLSIIIVAYNSNKEVAECFKSLSKFNPIGRVLEVVVVDNKPDTGLNDLLCEEPCNFTFRYVPNAANTGFGGGNNLGVKASSAPNVMFLNPDTIAVDDFITPTLKALSSDSCVVVGYRLIDREGHLNNSYSYMPEYVFLFPLLHLLERFSFNFFINKVPFINSITWPWGAAFSLHRDKFVEAGGFDENIFLCNEEPDLMKRISHRKVCVLNVPIIHLEGHGREVPVKRYAAYLQSTDYYLKKHNIRLRKLFWWWTATKLWLKKLRGADKNTRNLIEAFEAFKHSSKNIEK